MRPRPRAFTPQQSSTATSNSAGDLWTCYAISTCYGRKALRLPARSGPDAGRTRRYFGADSSVPARTLAIFLQEQVDLALLDSRQSRASCNNVPGASRRWEVSGKVSRQATARQDNKKRPWWKELLESLGGHQGSHQQLPRLIRLDLDAHVDDSPGRVGL